MLTKLKVPFRQPHPLRAWNTSLKQTPVLSGKAYMRSEVPHCVPGNIGPQHRTAPLTSLESRGQAPCMTSLWQRGTLIRCSVLTISVLSPFLFVVLLHSVLLLSWCTKVVRPGRGC